MLKRLTSLIQKINKTHGIEISILPDGGMIINAVTIKLEKNKVVKEREINAIRSFDELSSKMTNAEPISISITGKGVLHKKLPPGLPTDKFFEVSIPNANPNDFYFEVTKSENYSFISIIRKLPLDNILSELKLRGFKILSVSLGPSAFQFILPFLNTEKNDLIRSNNYSIITDEVNEVIGIDTIPFTNENVCKKIEYSIGDQYVTSSAILAFASALHLLSGGLDQDTGNNNVPIQEEKEDYRYYKYYKAGLWAIMIGVFTILLTNFFLYEYYFTENGQQQVSLLNSQNEHLNVEKLAAGLETKEKFINELGWSQPSRLSFFADRIAGLVPDNTSLTSIILYPVKFGILGDDSPMSFKRDTIEIAGTCEDATELNRFGNNLKNIREFKQVTIRNYSYKKESQNGSFLIEIITIQ